MRITGLPSTDEDGQQLLDRRRREPRRPVQRQGRPAVVTRGGLRRDVELLERNGRRVDERTRDRAAATRRDVEAERQVGSRARDRGRRRLPGRRPRSRPGERHARDVRRARARRAAGRSRRRRSRHDVGRSRLGLRRAVAVLRGDANAHGAAAIGATSACTSTCSPPLMLEQLPPFGPQRRNWYAYVIGVVPFHEPELAVSTEPTVVAPLIVGGDWFVGAASLACDREAGHGEHCHRAGPEQREQRSCPVSWFPFPSYTSVFPSPGCNP